VRIVELPLEGARTGGYFGFCQTRSVLAELDRWIRRRPRAFSWTQWKHGPARYAELRRRGADPELAAASTASPERPWRLSASGA